jgi:TonB family protein
MAIEGDREKPEDVELARAQAREEVQNRGALEVLNNLGPSSMFGGDSAEGLDDLQAIGSTQGEGVGAAYGQSGLGRYGGGFGAGGTLRQSGVSGGPIGLGGRSSGGNLGGNLRQNVERAARPPTVVPGTGGVTGGLDMAIIRRVITEHRREIVACYESALQRNPELEGRVVIEWVIAPDGAVAAAKVANTTLNNADVEACMQRRVRQWRFPEPKGGVTARVNFPWVFTPGD